MKNNKKLNNNGFSLIELMTTIGILGVVSLGAMRMMESLRKSSKSAETKNEISILSSQIFQVLADKNGCEQTFSNLGDLSTISEIDIASIKNSLGLEKFKAYKHNGDIIYGNGSVKIKSMKLKTEYDPKTKGYKSGFLGVKNEANETTLELVFEKMSKDTNRSLIKKRFPVSITLDGDTGKLSSCYSQSNNLISTTVSLACGSIGGSYNSTKKTCKLVDYPSTEGDLAVSKEYLDNEVANKISNYHNTSVNPYLLKGSCNPGFYLAGMTSSGSLVCKAVPGYTGGSK